MLIGDRLMFPVLLGAELGTTKGRYPKALSFLAGCESVNWSGVARQLVGGDRSEDGW